MKKNFFLTLMLLLLALFNVQPTMAQFAPVAGKMYALREVNSGLYLDIQTLGVNEPGQSGTNNISYSTKPCVIYFTAGTTDNSKWTLKNVNGSYAMQASNRNWNAVIGTTAYEWLITETGADTDLYTIARADGKFIQGDDKANGKPLYCDKGEGAKFQLVACTDFVVNTHVYSTLKTSNDTYLNFTKHATLPTEATFQATPTNLHIIPLVGGYFIMQQGTGKYLVQAPLAGVNDTWSVSASSDPYMWLISEEDTDGFVTISKFSAATDCLGNNEAELSVGTGVFANVTSGCNKWLIEETNIYSSSVPNFTDEVSVISSNGQYLTALTLDNISVLSGLSAPSTTEDMYIEAPVTSVTLEPNGEYTFGLTFPKNQTSQILAANLWIDKEGDGTFETHLGTTGAVNSNSNDLSTVTFVVPSDANQILTRIRLRLDSSWAIKDAADADANRMVYDIPVTITVPPTYTFYIENPSSETVEATYNGISIENGAKIEGGVNISLISSNDIEGYVWSVVIDRSAKTVTLVYEKEYSISIAGAPNGAVVTYNGKEVTTGRYVGTEYDTQYLSVTCPNGYTWEVARDDENKTIIITFIQLQVEENPVSVVALLNRIGGDGTADKFKIVLDPSLNYTAEQFSIGGEDGKVLIKGTTLSAITAGIGWYLQNHAHINIAWNSLNEKTVSGAAYADLSSIPVPTSEDVHTSDAVYRYYLNTCAFGYSMTSWTWKRWQQEIDWMALHGINMPLQLVGLEEVWRLFLTMEDDYGNRKYGYTDEEAKAFVAGPAFIAWWAMNNLEGWGGTAPGAKSGGTWEGAGGVQDDAWYARQQQLATQILTRQRELGMQPVLPGWSGMVPSNFYNQSGYVTRDNGGWVGGFTRPLILSVSNANYAEIAADYYACLREVMGESRYYSMDPFHEGGGSATTEDYAAMYEAMEAAKPGSQWVIQQWQWSQTNQSLSLKAMPAGRLVVLDLFSDGSPEFARYSGYAPQDAVFCAIPNFGGRSGLMGRLTNLTDNYFSYKAQYSTIKGVGAAPEAIEQTPVAYDLIFQLPWMNGVKPDVAEWVNNYSIARYGIVNDEIQEAWSLLRQGPLNYGADGIQGPVEDVWAARPNLTANKASEWGKTLNHAQGTYTKERQQMLIDATYRLLSQSSAISGDVYLSNYYYDLVEFGGGVLADYAYYLLLGINTAKTAAGANFETDATYIARRDAFLALIEDVDAFKGTNLNFRLGKWTQEARDAAAEAVKLGATTANADWYEYNNARTIVSTWSTPNTNLNDYSYRSWQGLLKDLYLPRWKHYFENGCTTAQYGYFEWNWAHGKEHYVGQTAVSNVALTEGQAGHTSSYTRDPEGNTVDVAKEVLGKYIIPISGVNGTYYAYRYLSNDLTAVCTVVASTGAFLDLSTYFGELEGATVTGDFIDSETGTSTNFKALPIKSDVTDGAHTGTITLTDGTVFTFAVVINPAFNGVYKLVAKSYMNGSGTHEMDAPVFIAYNTDNTDNPKSVDYKLMAEGTYSPSATADVYFTITPQGLGYRLQAQGMYVRAPQNLSNWGHILASGNSSEAGSYIFEETGADTDIFKIKNYTGNNPYLNAWDKYIFGNEDSSKYSTFTFTEHTEYTVNVPSTGYTTLYLPFNVVLPTGVTAYTVEPAKIIDDGNGGYGYMLTQVAVAGEMLLNGTPVIIKAAEGDYLFRVTIDNANAKTVASSALRGTYFAKNVNSDETTKAYTVTVEDGVLVFAQVDSETGIAANSCWLETGADVEKISKLTNISLVDGGVYRIKGQLSNGTFRTLYTSGAKTNIRWTEETKTDASTLFVMKEKDDKYYLISALADGVWSNDCTLTENGVALTLVDGSVAPTYMIVGDSNRRFAVTGAGTSGELNYYDNCNDAPGTYVGKENSTDFFFEQVSASEVSFTVLFKAGQQWETMFLPYAVSISGDADAYTSTIDDIEGTVINLTKIDGVIPARTAVLLNRTNADAEAGIEFCYTTEAGDDYTNNLFLGFVQTTAVPVDKDSEKCYLLLSQKNDEAMYRVYAEYNKDCVASNPGTDDGGYVKCDANRAYMLLNSTHTNTAKYSFRINGEATGIVEVNGEIGAVRTIYDLQGRKLTEITEPGVYIIDGNKVLVK